MLYKKQSKKKKVFSINSYLNLFNTSKGQEIICSTTQKEKGKYRAKE
jgi:hypothetical protein